jgi:hypothetical protein
MSATMQKHTVEKCVAYARKTERPTPSVFNFVHQLIHQHGWSEVEARQVGAKALIVLGSRAAGK